MGRANYVDHGYRDPPDVVAERTRGKGKRISNSEISSHVKDMKTFTNRVGSCYAEWRGSMYVVFSYGEHYPLAIHDQQGRWWVNTDKASATTDELARYARPREPATGLPTTAMLEILNYGTLVAALAKIVGPDLARRFVDYVQVTEKMGGDDV